MLANADYEDYHWRVGERDKSKCNIMFKHKELEDILESLIYVEGMGKCGNNCKYCSGNKPKRICLKDRFIDAIERGMAKPLDYNK